MSVSVCVCVVSVCVWYVVFALCAYVCVCLLCLFLKTAAEAIKLFEMLSKNYDE